MLKFSIVFKLGAAIMLLMLSVLLPLGFIINRVFTNFYFTNLENGTKNLSEKYSNNINTLEDPALLNMFKGLAELTNKEIIIINQKGQVIENSGIKGFRVNKDDLKRLSRGQTLSREYTEVSESNRYFASASPVINNATFKGAIYVFASTNEATHSLQALRSSLILAGLGAIFLALGFTYYLSRRLSRPLLKMEEATKRIAKGDLSVRIDVLSNDELGSLTAAINDLTIELERYRTNRSEFFADISHELRTPITYLSGYANVLKNKLYHSDDEKDQYLTIIQDEAMRLNQLINDLFDLAKMEEGKVNLNLVQIDLVKVLKNSTTKIKFEADKKGLEVRFEITDENHFIIGDAFRLEQILDNLLGNAVRYTEKGFIDVSLKTDRNLEVVQIKDTGPGIPDNEINQIFERFYRVERSRSRNTGGTGLGLAIVKELVILHHGSINIESEVGNGTTLTLTFPHAKGENTHEMV